MENVTANDTNTTTSRYVDSTDSTTVFFLSLSFALGAAVRHLLNRTPLPYTVILILIGLLFGSAPRWDVLSFLLDYLKIAQIDPHLMLKIFLPALIFESAFVIDIHTMKRTIIQAIILAGPGLVLSAVLLAVMAVYIFTYNWSWVVGLIFGTILSATDPVAVVALLKDLGTSKQLGVIIESESLLNDGAAIVLFNVLTDELIPGRGRNALQIVLYFIQVVLGGPVFGFVIAKVTIFWLSRVFNNALVEITITLASTYITYYIGEEFLHVSGVLAVVVLGFEINSHKANISPEVELFLHRFWEVLGYLANTVIFILVGVVIAQRAFQDVQLLDWMFNVALYLAIVVIRFLIIGGLFPIFTRVGYSMNLKHVVIITWGGLKGAVSLALALTVAQTTDIDFFTIGSKVLFHTAGIVMWTLILNATTTKYILRFLKLNDISSSRYKTISLAVSRVKETKARAVSLLKSDRFLADADWDEVESRVQISNPYKHVKSSVVNVKALEANCSSCSHRITYPLTPQEKAELSEQLRNRIIQLEKTSYWRQFEQGMLSGEAVRILMSLADTVLDKPDRLIEFKDIVSHWHIPRIFSIIPQYIVWIFVKLKITHPPPKNKLLLLFYKVGEHPLFVWSIYIPVLINLLCIILQLAIMGNHTLTTVLEAFNYFFCFVYIVEEIIKMMAFRLYYWLDWWNLIDLAVLCVAIIDIVVYLVVEDEIKVTVLLYVRFILAARLIKLIQVNEWFNTQFIRSITLFDPVPNAHVILMYIFQLVLPISVKIIEYMINRWLRLGYDIGRGFVVGEEEVLNQFDSFKLVHEPTASKFKQRIETTKLNIIKSMNLIRQKHPGIALSVKTHHAARTILNQCQDTVKTMFSNGILEEIDADKLLLDIENKTKKLEFGSITMAPLDTDRLLFHLQWLDGVDIDAVATLKQYTVLRQYDTGNCLIKVGDVPDGAYIIISGIVKVVVPSSHNPNDPDQILDFLGAGSLVGEMAILKKNTLRTASVICETDIQAFYISKDDLWKVLEQFPVLENKLWKIFGVRIAITLLSKLPQYQEWSTSKLTIMCENSYIISMSDDETVKVFDITKDMKEVIVIEGEASCPATGEIITSPAVISRNIKSLKIVRISTRLLVTPAECTDGSMDVASSWAAAEGHHHQNKHHPTGRTSLTAILRKPLSYWHQFTHRVSEAWNDLMHVELHHNGRIFPQTISGEEEFINVTLTRSPLAHHVDNPVTIETITRTTAIN